MLKCLGFRLNLYISVFTLHLTKAHRRFYDNNQVALAFECDNLNASGEVGSPWRLFAFVCHRDSYKVFWMKDNSAVGCREFATHGQLARFVREDEELNCSGTWFEDLWVFKLNKTELKEAKHASWALS